MKSVLLTISGMHCVSCATVIDIDIEEIAGVFRVHTDYRKGTTSVDFDGTEQTLNKIMETINVLGYSAALKNQ